MLSKGYLLLLLQIDAILQIGFFCGVLTRATIAVHCFFFRNTTTPQFGRLETTLKN